MNISKKVFCFIKNVYSGILRFFTYILPEFLKNNFEVTSTKHSRITGISVTAALIITTVIDCKEFLSLDFSQKWLLLAFCLVFPFVIGALIFYKIRITDKTLNCIWHFLLILLLPIVTISMTECLNNIFIYDMTYLGFFGNYMLVLLLYFFVFAVSGSFRATVIAVNVPLFGLAVAHCYIMEFRGTPFIPMDFLSITTALNVANTYTFKLMYTVLIAAMIFIFLIVTGIKLNTPDFHTVTKAIVRGFMGTFFAAIMGLFFLTSIFADAGVKPDFWNQSRGYKNYGFAFNFFCNTKYLYMSTPNGYNPDEVGQFVDKTVKEESTPMTPPENAPNIICIMNESLSDLKVLGDFETNEDYMPFLHSLTENTVKGNLYVPVIGAGTSNTEFEFLTGHSTAFLPSGSNAYMLYIKNPIASIVSTLEGQGYSSLAFHPYYSSGWNRVDVYKYMSFNNTAFLENIMDISIMNEFMQNSSNPDYIQTLIDQNYPDRNNMILRQYISDSYNYRVLIEDFENRDKTVPYFAFNVTMQNHGGYTTKFSNFNESITLTSADFAAYPKTNRYLSLVKESDKAFSELINYFKGVKEHTVICMFGDHQPSIETSFVSNALGVDDLSNLTPEQEQNRHVTPFVIWANYDIEEETVERLSANYLSTYVLKVAGVNLTEYNRYLLKLSEKIPVIDTVGYIDFEGNYYNWNDRTDYTEMLNEYEKIQYNNIFDSKNKNTDIFYLKGYKGDEGIDLDSEEE